MRLLVLLASLGPRIVEGDGPLETSSPSPTSSAPASSTSSGLPVCNPASGDVRYLAIGCGGPISAGVCQASWDLHEVEMFSPSHEPISLSVSAVTGTHDSYPASNAIDGDPNSFWAGDFVIGMACTCWEWTKLDTQAITLDMATARPVGSIHITQGNNEWAMKDIRIRCGDSNGNFDAFAPLVLEISWETTIIGCTTTGGCAVTYMSQTPTWSCSVVSWSPMSTGSFLLLATYFVLILH